MTSRLQLGNSGQNQTSVQGIQPGTISDYFKILSTPGFIFMAQAQWNGSDRDFVLRNLF